MVRALRVISVERGHDPRDFTLVSFGGAGGLHAADLARQLGIPRALISPYAATLSALGMLTADVVRDYSRTVMLPGETDRATLEGYLAPLIARGRRDLAAEGVPPGAIETTSSLDMRYQGQSFELPIPLDDDPGSAFHQAHLHLYGYANETIPLEIVNVRVRATGSVPPPQLPEFPPVGPDPTSALLGRRPLLLPEGERMAPFFQGAALRPGNRIAGPAVVLRPDTTVLLGPGDQATVDRFLNLLIEVAPPESGP